MANRSQEESQHAADVAAAWDRVWGANVAALPLGDPSRALVEAWWRRELRGLGRIQRLLEIGAGADATVATLVAREFPGVPVIASDYRALPAIPDGKIVRVANAPIESLPFPDAHIDILVSQFAFEYADRPRAVAEVVRVVRPGGAARMLLHHASSHWSKKLVHRLRTQQAALALERILMDTRITGTSRAVKIRQCQSRLRELHRAQSRGSALPDVLADIQDFIDMAHRGLDAPAGPVPESDQLALAQAAPALLLTRLQMQATLTSADITALQQQFVAAGCRATHDLLTTARGQPLAWVLRLQR